MFQILRERLIRWLPPAETLRQHPWLQRLGPGLHHPRLWHVSRRGVSLGVALGLFFGLMVPIAQIPCAAVAAVVARANVPAAVASTLVTNPVTFGPIYYAAWKLGGTMLGDPSAPPPPPELVQHPKAPVEEAAASADPDPLRWWERVERVGKPLIVGLTTMAVTSSVLAFCLLEGVWRWRSRRRWQRRALRRGRNVAGD